MVKKSWMVAWMAAGIYFVVASEGGGGGLTAAMAMLCGFMVARNMADIVSAKQK